MEEILDSVFKLTSREQDSTKLRGSKNIKLKILWKLFTIAIFRILFWFFRYIISYKCDIPQNKKIYDFLFFFEFFGTKCMWGSMKSVEFVVNSTHSSHIAWLWSIISSIHTRLSGFGAKKKFFFEDFLFWGISSSLILCYPKIHSKILKFIVWKNSHKIFHHFACFELRLNTVWTQSACVESLRCLTV